MQDILFIFKKYVKDIIIFILILISLSLAVYSMFKNNESINTLALDMPEEEQISEKLKAEETTIYHVDIKGAITNPGVYEVKEGTIIGDVISLAGGLKDNAYEEGINLSKKVSDEMVIYIYTDTQVRQNIGASNVNKPFQNTTCTTASYNIIDCVTLTESIIIPKDENTEENESTSEINKLININTATKEELITLSGIGEAKAEEIINYRKANGYFANIEDILNVKGIGDAIFAKIKDFITV